MKYRPEVDGLRAVAVLPVILFHAGIAPFHGGFIGVDVFFVISGYLITSIILREIEADEFSILRFYERRARRILPALFLVLLVCIPFSWLWMFPDQYRSFAGSVVATTTFVSNIYFWNETGYFDGAAELKPLLHTWSLAVEEQFYLFFPALLIFAWRWHRQRAFQIVVLLAAASFGLSEWGWRNAQNANFYLAPARIWELFAGAICAFLMDRRAFEGRDAAGLVGLVMICSAIFLYNKHTPFPSVYALLPVLGTCFVILWGTAGTFTAWLLSRPVFVGIGAISYSAYLWHQPVFAYARLSSELVPTDVAMLGLSALTLALAYLSWRFVEQPARRRGSGYLPNRGKVFAFAGTGMAVFVAMGLLAATTIPPFISLPDLRHRAEAAERPVPIPSVRPAMAGRACEDFAWNGPGVECAVFGTGPGRLVVWGDSHGMSLRPVIEPVAGQSIYLVTHTGCPPLVGAVLDERFGENDHCAQAANSEAVAEAIRALQPDSVLLVGRWMVYLNGWRRYGELQSETHLLQDGRPGTDAVELSRAVFRDAMIRTVETFSPHSSVFVATQPADLAYLTNDGHYYTLRGMFFVSDSPKVEIDELHRQETNTLAVVAKNSPARVIDSRAHLCPQDSCLFWIDGMRLYADDNHLSDEGSAMIWEYYLSEIERISTAAKAQ